MPKLNLEIIGWNITEAREELERIEHLIKENKLGEEEFQVKMEHSLHHLSVAWNARQASTERYSKMSENDFNAWSKFPEELEPFSLNS